MIDLIITAVLIIILSASVTYIIKQKKKGKCIGCPMANECNHTKSEFCKKGETPL